LVATAPEGERTQRDGHLGTELCFVCGRNMWRWCFPLYAERHVEPGRLSVKMHHHLNTILRPQKGVHPQHWRGLGPTMQYAGQPLRHSNAGMRELAGKNLQRSRVVMAKADLDDHLARLERPCLCTISILRADHLDRHFAIGRKSLLLH